jgi:hypothetical protein
LSINEQKESSTWRELSALLFSIESFMPKLKDKQVLLCTDNQNCVRIVENGSTKSRLHEISIKIFNLCLKENISLLTEWVPRSQNEIADCISKFCDVDDWGVSDDFFCFMDDLWGTHTVDRFANHYNNRILRFNSRFWVPETEAVNAFSCSWAGENNWLVPPISIVPQVINYLEKCKAKGTLIIPNWPSAPFWPMLFGDNSIKKAHILDILMFSSGQDIFVQYLNKNTILVRISIVKSLLLGSIVPIMMFNMLSIFADLTALIEFSADLTV